MENWSASAVYPPHTSLADIIALGFLESMLLPSTISIHSGPAVQEFA